MKKKLKFFFFFLIDEKIAEKEEVVSVYKSKPRKYSLQTTRSWEFSGLEKAVPFKTEGRDDDVLLKSRYGKNVIVGIIDSGMYLINHFTSLNSFFLLLVFFF